MISVSAGARAALDIKKKISRSFNVINFEDVKTCFESSKNLAFRNPLRGFPAFLILRFVNFASTPQQKICNPGFEVLQSLGYSSLKIFQVLTCCFLGSYGRGGTLYLSPIFFFYPSKN